MNRIAAICLLGCLAALAAPALGQETPVREGMCGWFVKGPDSVKSVDDPQLHVLDQTRGDFKPASTLEGREGVFCARSDIVPAQNDYKVLEAGYPLVIYAPVGGKTSMLLFEIVDGQLQARNPPDTLSAEDKARVAAYLNAAQPFFNKK